MITEEVVENPLIEARIIDDDGFVVKVMVVERNKEYPSNIIKVRPPHGLYRARWVNGEWVEDATQNEIDEKNNIPKQPTPEERISRLEDALLIQIDNELGGIL
ncbi:hypothetical protein [Lysinibacillus fusiformis]|uniref:hypothetical protein n=1 Tax=Lysinibacillus fusiformis TaxID=28031 RepID=UPI00263AA666|nr:hypothetical protein [Lysinibacillus fusiformis]MDC6267720.1 hypothetical protein [Lysinibacillus sphaericus]MDN4967790.1 hypothetical protein [Lysinibacillus fusiformis]MDN4967846.1 hypothetical protein [Lysinibacillus fusiformis]